MIKCSVGTQSHCSRLNKQSVKELQYKAVKPAQVVSLSGMKTLSFPLTGYSYENFEAV